MFFRSTEKLKTSYTHPLDPSVDHEYELLVHSWKDQLVQRTPQIPNTDYTRYAWIQLMDHYLDQQWLDSKQMLQCAQAWSGRESISLSEAVHTMNILSLKFMQRSLETRKELLNTLNDPDLMMALGIPPPKVTANLEKEEHIQGNESIYTNTEDQTPLLFESDISQKSASISIDYDSSEQEQQQQLLDECEVRRDSFLSEDIKTRSVFEDEDNFEIKSCLRHSKSTPDFLFEISLPDNRNSQSMNYFTDDGKKQYRSDNSSVSSSTTSSQSEFFLHSRDGPIDDSTNFFTIRQSTLYKAGFADEKVETDSLFDEMAASPNLYLNDKPHVKNQEKFNIVKSGSSISIFEPNNSMDDQTNGLLCPNKRATLVKSRSFPTKEALQAADNKQTANKERGFLLRSIVSKKPSFSNFFGVKRN